MHKNDLSLPQLECSFHKGNCFLSLFVRVYRAPDRASGELIDTGNGNDQEQTPFLVEIQHREGDRLQFTSLFREIMREFKVRRLSIALLIAWVVIVDIVSSLAVLDTV